MRKGWQYRTDCLHEYAIPNKERCRPSAEKHRLDFPIWFKHRPQKSYVPFSKNHQVDRDARSPVAMLRPNGNSTDAVPKANHRRISKAVVIDGENVFKPNGASTTQGFAKA